MAAEEEQREGVVRVVGPARRGVPGHRDLALAAGAVRPPLVHQGTGGDGQQPGARLLGHALDGPPLGGREQRLLHRVLARVELAVPPRERAEDPRREVAQQVLDGRPAAVTLP